MATPVVRLLLILLLGRSDAWSSWFSGSKEEENLENDLVSPIVNRQIQVSVKAHHWPSSPAHSVFCEAYTLEGVGFLDSLVSIILGGDTAQNDEEARKLAVIASRHPNLLEWSLLLRAASPYCELMRSLSPDETGEDDVVAVIGDGLVLRQSDLEDVDWKELVERLQDMQPGRESSPIIPDEPILGDTSAKHLVVLYANMGSISFAKIYRKIIGSGVVRFVVRHLGMHKAAPILLQGYGVRLDIRNVEYKVFDDRSDVTNGGKVDSGLINATASSLPSQFLAGVNLTQLGMNEEAQVALWKRHDRQPIVPPVWQRRRLPLQIATVISQSKDPLYTMQSLLQDLPSTASTLVHVPVDEAVAEAAENKEKGTQSGLLYINGKVAAYLDRPSFNVFEVVAQIRKEQVKVDDLVEQFSGQPKPFLHSVYQAWMSGSGQETSSSTDVRINVGRGWKKAILYLNDVERDAQYSSWTRSVRQAIMSLQYGMPPSVRRNLFTVLSVFDPIESLNSHGLEFGFQLAQSSYPVRLGLLIVSKTEVAECAKWLKSKSQLSDEEGCPINQNILAPRTTLADLQKLPATTQAIHRIFTQFAAEESFGQGLVMAYAEYFVSLMAEWGSPTMLDLLELHGKILSGLRIGSDGKEEAFDILKGKEHKDHKYGKALRFAAEKGLSPGLSFLNGKPFKEDQTFMDEQRKIFSMIAKGEITDSTPKSVYGHLLSTGSVFPKLHPLLASGDDEKVAHVKTPTAVPTTAALSTSNDAVDSDAFFVVDAVLDYDTQIGLETTVAVISTLASYKVSLEESVGVQFRILPSTPDASASVLCPLLLNGELLGANRLGHIISESTLPFDSLANLLDGLDLPPEARKVIEDDTTCGNLHDFVKNLNSPRQVVANGRVFEIDGRLESDDLDLLLSLGIERSKIATQIVKQHFDLKSESHLGLLIARVAEFLGNENGKRKLFDLNEGPLEFEWNKQSTNEYPRVQITAVVDPASEGAQRAAPLLRAIRDQLLLPLNVILTPDEILDDNAKIPITSYYRFVIDGQQAVFSNLPTNQVLTLRVDVPEAWNVQQTAAIQDTDNLRCDVVSGCSDTASLNGEVTLPLHEEPQVTTVEFGLKNLLVSGQCYETTKNSPPNGLQLNLIKEEDWSSSLSPEQESFEISADGSMTGTPDSPAAPIYSDTLVMKNVGYWQVPANPGMWKLSIAAGTKGEEIFEMVDGTARNGRIVVESEYPNSAKSLVLKDFVDSGELLLVRRREGYESSSIFHDEKSDGLSSDDDVINVFSLATGHLYERFLKIMMLSVTKRTSSKVKFWLFENFLSPTFKSSATAMAERIGCQVEFVTYKWPEWLRGQSEKQRIIWGYKILFLDVLFPLSVKKIIYVDADQVVRGDLKELWDMDLKGAAYGYTPFCDSRETTLGYQFWRDGFWKNHLQGRPYHISALYVVDLDRFRRTLVGDQLRSIYQQLSADPNSLANLDQDLPNYAQHQVPIFSLPQEWLWCESWCSDETKATAKTIDLCNNPLHKEPKVSMAKRIISGSLFNESWVELDEEVERYELEFHKEQQREGI